MFTIFAAVCRCQGIDGKTVMSRGQTSQGDSRWFVRDCGSFQVWPILLLPQLFAYLLGFSERQYLRNSRILTFAPTRPKYGKRCPFRRFWMRQRSKITAKVNFSLTRKVQNKYINFENFSDCSLWLEIHPFGSSLTERTIGYDVSPHHCTQQRLHEKP